MNRKSNQKTRQKKKSRFIYVFKIIPDPVYFHPLLSHTNKMVWLAIAHHYNSISKLCNPSISTIAESSGLNENTIKRSRKILRKLELLNWRMDKKDGKTSQYEIPLISSSKQEQVEALRNIAGYLKDTLAKYPKDTREVSKRYLDQLSKILCFSSANQEQTTISEGKKPPNKKKELEEINNNRPEVVHPFTVQIPNQIQKQICHFQDTMKEWKLSSEKLKPFDLLEVLLWMEHIEEKISQKDFIPENEVIKSPAGYLLSCLQNKSRKIAAREEKIGELMEKWIPEEELAVDQDEYWFPRWRYLEDLIHEHKMPVSDLLKEGLLDDKRILDDGMWLPLLDEFNRENMEILRDGSFEERLQEYNKEVEEREAQMKEIKDLRGNPDKFFESIKEKVLKGGDFHQKANRHKPQGKSLNHEA